MVQQCRCTTSETTWTNSNFYSFLIYSVQLDSEKSEREKEAIHLAMCGAGWIIFWWSGIVVCMCNVKSITVTFWNRRCVTFPLRLNVTRNFTASISWKSFWFWLEKQSQPSTKCFDQTRVCNEFIEQQRLSSMNGFE